MQFSPLQIFTLLGVAQGLIISALFLFSPFFKSKANRYLAVTLSTISLIGLLYTLDAPASGSAWLIFLNDIMWELLFPASLFRYFVTLLEIKAYQSPRFRWIYVPFLLTLFVNLLLDLSHEFNVYDLGLGQGSLMVQTYYMLEEVGAIVFALGLMAWLFFLIQRAVAPANEKKWALEFWWTFVVGVCCWFVTWFIFQLTELDYLLFVWPTITFLLFLITYRGVFQFRLAEQRFEIRERLNKQLSAKKSPEIVEVKKEESLSTPGDLETETYLIELERLMQEEFLYREPTLSRDDVAERLGISPGYLSRKLSTHHSVSFSDYINGFRVGEVQNMLIDPEFERYSLVAIGYEAGFNSKSAFYSTFRKVTNLTPSAYKTQQLGQIPAKTLS